VSVGKKRPYTAVFDKRGEIYFSGAVLRDVARAKAQALRRFSRQNWIRLLLWGFGRNGDASVALQGVGSVLFRVLLAHRGSAFLAHHKLAVLPKSDW